MKTAFIKIQGLGNDYIYADRKSFAGKGSNLARIARQISDRHYGVGSDGLIVVKRTEPDAAFIEIFNSDGSRAEMCGNGLRGTALYFKFVYKSKMRKFDISTDWNNYEVEMIRSDDRSAKVKTSMGEPIFEAKAIGYKPDAKNCLGISLESGSRTWTVFCLAMPNPHAVIFVDNFDFDWQREGMKLENHPAFKNKINVMFTHVESRNRISVMPWERGAGATLACGSGAAAATVISNLLEYTSGKVTVNMPGGSLGTFWDIKNNQVHQEGPTTLVFSGFYSS